MRIGVDVSRALRTPQTGTERYALEITRHLLQLPQAAKHEWRLYADVEPPGDLFGSRTPGASNDNVSVAVLEGKRLWTHRSLAAELLARPPDVLFVPAHVIPFVLPPGRLPPSVVTIHDLGYRQWPDTHTWQQRAYLDWSTRWSAGVASRVIAVSRATADDLQSVYGTDRRKIDVIYEATVPNIGTVPSIEPSTAPGIVPDTIPADAALPASAPPATHDETGLPRPYALYVGTIQPRKNLLRLAQAYAGLVRTNAVEWDLVLAGGLGWKSEAVVNEIDALGLSGRIHRLGYVPESKRQALLHGAHLFCYVSLYEGFGLPVLEAQSAGVPVMTSTNSSLPEVAGDAAILVDPTNVDAIAEAMLRLSSDEPLRQRLIAAGHANVARFSWTKAARETLEVLLRAAESRRP
jgi:glycosyltransferase involved in cell wall biosynthesis